MVKLTPLQNQLAYAGAFDSPVMELWGAPKPMLEGLLGTLAEFGAQLSGMEAITSPAMPLDYSVTFDLRGRARVEFKLGGISAEIANFVDDEVSDFAAVLAAADGWLKSGVLSRPPQITSHVVTVSGHYEMEGTTAPEFLAAGSDLALECFGKNRGSGTIYHGDLVEGKRRIQLSVDHSVIHDGALFLSFVMVVAEDAVAYEELFADGEALVMASVKELGLEFGNAD